MTITNDLERYEAARASTEFVKARDYDSAKLSLEGLANSMGMDDDAKILLKGTTASRDGIRSAANDFTNQYNVILGGSNATDLIAHYEDKTIFDDYFEGNEADKARSVINDGLPGTTNYGEVRRRFTEASNIIDDTDGNYTANQKEDAEKYVLDNQKIIAMISTFESIKLSKLMTPLQAEGHKARLKSLIQ